jgi:hypothetical protein
MLSAPPVIPIILAYHPLPIIILCHASPRLGDSDCGNPAEMSNVVEIYRTRYCSLQRLQVRPINCRYLAMTSCLSDSKISLFAPDNEFGSEDLICRVGAGNAGGACTG